MPTCWHIYAYIVCIMVNSIFVHTFIMQIQDLTSEVVDLCDKSALAFRSFQSSAADALYQIKSCLSFFSEGFGEIALDSIEETLESAKCIEDKANYLSEEFKRVEHEVKGTLEERQNHKGEKRIKKVTIIKYSARFFNLVFFLYDRITCRHSTEDGASANRYW